MAKGDTKKTATKAPKKTAKPISKKGKKEKTEEAPVKLAKQPSLKKTPSTK